jgi:CRP-like cAMP-binding protein
MTELSILVSVANVIYLVSYSVRDILWLRILTIIGATLLLPFYYLQPEPLWTPFVWNLVFITINVFWVAKLLLERRPVKFSAEEERLYREALRNLTEREAQQLFRLGTWTTVSQGTTLITQGRPLDGLMLIVEGAVAVEVDGELVDTIEDGRFLGAAAFLSAGTDFEAPSAVTASRSTRIVTWPTDALEAKLSRDARLAVAIEASLGLELSRLLSTSRHELLQARAA